MISQLSSDDCRISMCYRITCLLWGARVSLSLVSYSSPVIAVLQSMHRFDLLFGHISTVPATSRKRKKKSASVKRKRPRSQLSAALDKRRKTDAFQSTRNTRSDSSGPNHGDFQGLPSWFPLLMRTKPSIEEEEEEKQLYTNVHALSQQSSTANERNAQKCTQSISCMQTR